MFRQAVEQTILIQTLQDLIRKFMAEHNICLIPKVGPRPLQFRKEGVRIFRGCRYEKIKPLTETKTGEK
jgi:hypothetical protein